MAKRKIVIKAGDHKRRMKKAQQMVDVKCEKCKQPQKAMFTGTAQDASQRCQCGGRLLQLEQENWMRE
jgi:hypothetical protein